MMIIRAALAVALALSLVAALAVYPWREGVDAGGLMSDGQLR